MAGKFTAKKEQPRKIQKSNIDNRPNHEHDHLSKLNLEIGLANEDPDAFVFLSTLSEDVQRSSPDMAIATSMSINHARTQQSSHDIPDMPGSITKNNLFHNQSNRFHKKSPRTMQDKQKMNKESSEKIPDVSDLISSSDTTSPQNSYVIGNKDKKSGGIYDKNNSSNDSLSDDSQESTSLMIHFRTKPKYILLPHSDFRSAWDLYMSLILIYVAIFVPYRVSFLGELTGFLRYLDLFIDLSFGVDIILNFFTAYDIQDVEKYEYSLRKIALRYCKGFFLLDFIATFPFDLVLASSATSSGINQASKLTKLPKIIKFLRVARLLKLLRVHRLSQFFRYVELNYNIHQGISRLVNIVGTIMIATHLVGCLWHAIGVDLDIKKSRENCPFDFEDIEHASIGYEGGWVCREGLSEASDGHKYAASVYWAFSTLTTVGYGDISARTVTEQCFSMIMMLLGVSWYAYVVGSMSTIISSFDRQKKQVRLKMMQVNAFIQESKIPIDLGSRIRKYFEYSLTKKSNGLFGYDADQILNELSSTLRIDVITHVEEKLIKRIPFFNGKSSTFVANAIQAFQPIVVHGGDYIIKEGSAADEMYFLVKGRAVVYYGNKSVASLESGSYFGEIGCILGGIRRASIMADTTCELQCLSKRNLNMLLGQHPEVGEDLKKVARERMGQVKQKKDSKRKQNREEVFTEIKDNHQDSNSIETLSYRTEKCISDHKENVKDHVADAFSYLKSALRMNERRLSLTSCDLRDGNHKKANENDIAQLNQGQPFAPPNRTDTTTTPDKNLIRSDKIAERKDKYLSYLSVDDKLNNFKSLTSIERDQIHEIISGTVIELVETNLEQLCDCIIKNNRSILNGVVTEIKLWNIFQLKRRKV